MKSTASQTPRSQPSVRAPARQTSSSGKSAASAKGAMLIGALAQATGHSVHTIRWYESQRLIPAVRRDLQGRRTYIPWHIAWLDLIDRLRRTGLSIQQLREYAGMVRRGESTLAERLALMQAQRARIQTLQADLQRSLQLIDHKVDFYSRWLATGVQPQTHPDFRLKQVPGERK
jgi:DNA-binding transcriptional MerR regulator